MSDEIVVLFTSLGEEREREVKGTAGMVGYDASQHLSFVHGTGCPGLPLMEAFKIPRLFPDSKFHFPDHAG